MTNLEKLYVEKLKELIIVLKQQLDIMTDNKNTEVIRYIGLFNLNEELQKEIASLEHQIEAEERKEFVGKVLTAWDKAEEKIKGQQIETEEKTDESKLKEELIKFFVEYWGNHSKYRFMEKEQIIDEYLKHRNNG